jgi:hypothetical protein
MNHLMLMMMMIRKFDPETVLPDNDARTLTEYIDDLDHELLLNGMRAEELFRVAFRFQEKGKIKINIESSQADATIKVAAAVSPE